jgi:NADH-quinone oxidoreductase E subunit
MEHELEGKEIKAILGRYPSRQAALLPILRRIQARVGYISREAEAYAADLLEIHPSHIREVVAFYSRLRETPPGRYEILVCDSVCCALVGAEELIDHLKKRLQIEVGETTPDKLFTLEAVECLAQCEQAPAVIINDEVYGKVTPDEMDRILEEKRREG